MVEMLRKTVIFAAVVALLMLASGCSKSTADKGLTLPDAPKDADQPPALPPSEEGDSLPPLPEGEGNTGGVQLFG